MFSINIILVKILICLFGKVKGFRRILQMYAISNGRIRIFKIVKEIPKM
jgi:hypothetical protein